MRQRAFFYIFLLVLISSCQFFKLKPSHIEPTDSIINFSTVDVSPTFAVCDSLIDKKAISDCFRKTLHKELYKQLSEQQIIAEKRVSEIVQVFLKISNTGQVSLVKIEASNALKASLTNLDSLVALSLKKLPKVFPAIKRGIPVSTQYEVPISIRVAN